MPIEFNKVVLKFLVGMYYCNTFILIQILSEFKRSVVMFIVFLFLFKHVAGHRANQKNETIDKTNNRGIMGRMLGAVSNSVKIGTYVLDSVQQRTNDVIQSALH